MALLYYTMILDGRYKFKDVPNLWYDEVKEILIEEGHEDYIDDDDSDES